MANGRAAQGWSSALIAAVMGGFVSLATSFAVIAHQSSLDRAAEARTNRRAAYVEFVRAAADCAAVSGEEAAAEDARWLKAVDSFKAGLDDFVKGRHANPPAENFPLLSTISDPNCYSSLDGAAAGIYVIAPLRLYNRSLKLRDAAVFLYSDRVLLRQTLLSFPANHDIVKKQTEAVANAKHSYDVAQEDFEFNARIDVTTPLPSHFQTWLVSAIAVAVLFTAAGIVGWRLHAGGVKVGSA